ncbi:hypothetical protein C8R44DRAFT_878183 [Mycena epipterygia]|nr:hypothetical protein C8R44DRAFT_878183 [Mycena epipterygia]
MKSFSILALFSALGSLFVKLSATADLTRPFATISGTILERKTSAIATRQEGAWSQPLKPLVVLTPFGNYSVNGTTQVLFSNFNIPDGAMIDLRLGIQGRPSVAPNIFFTVSKSSPCQAVWTVMGDINSVVYNYTGLFWHPFSQYITADYEQAEAPVVDDEDYNDL